MYIPLEVGWITDHWWEDEKPLLKWPYLAFLQNYTICKYVCYTWNDIILAKLTVK